MKQSSEDIGRSPHLSRGDEYLRSGRLDEALSAYHQALEDTPGDPTVFNSIGFVFESQGHFKDALVSYQCALKIAPKTAQTYFRLGCTLQALGRLEASYAAFEEAVAIDPQHLSSHNNLGILAKMTGQFTQSRAHFERAIQIDETFGKARDNLARLLAEQGCIEDAVRIHEGSLAMNLSESRALHLLAALREDTPTSLPRDDIRQLFDDCASTFEQHLIGTLQYEGPHVICSLLRNVVARRLSSKSTAFETVLDLGCGTGLMGLALTNMSGKIDGVDLAPNMIKEAQRKTLYRDLFVGDCVDFLEGTRGQTDHYDLVVAADVFIYLGDLKPMFSAVRTRLSDNGIFAFSVEHLDSGTFALQSSGRFAHSVSYIQDLAREFGLRMEASRPGDLRIEQGEPIHGVFHILCVPASARPSRDGSHNS